MEIIYLKNYISKLGLLSICLFFQVSCKEPENKVDINEKAPVENESIKEKSREGIILYRKEGFFFTQHDMDNLIEFTEFLSRSPMTQKDKKALTQWAILDFKSNPEAGLNFYRVLDNKTIKKMRLSANNIEYKTRLFLSFSRGFRKKQEGLPKNHILKIIDHYNPPIKEALQLQALEHNIMMRLLQNNQTSFNSLMNTHQVATDQIIKSIKDHGDRSSIMIQGGKIIEERDNSYLVEDEIGDQYEVSR